MSDLDGSWDVVPLPGVRKRIEGDRGWTLVGPLRVPFDVRGLELHYRFPFGGVVDVLEPEGDGFRGRATLFGREVGRFRLRRPSATG
ncbi:MAG: hypothetical protein WD067_06755 [Gaiellaceae bacterium]